MSDSNTIESVLNESRLFPPSDEFMANAHIKGMDEYERLYAEAEADPEALLGEASRKPPLVPEMGHSSGMEFAPRQMVCRRHNECRVQLSGSASDFVAAQQSRDYLGRRAGRHADADLSATAHRSLQVCERAQKARRQNRRPRCLLHAADS